MSDIVFLRAWTKVEVPKFYNPLTTALQPRDRVWQGMKTVAELRKEHNLPIPLNKDSLYKVTSCWEKMILVVEFPSLILCSDCHDDVHLSVVFQFVFSFTIAANREAETEVQSIGNSQIIASSLAI